MTVDDDRAGEIERAETFGDLVAHDVDRGTADERRQELHPEPVVVER